MTSYVLSSVYKLINCCVWLLLRSVIHAVFLLLKFVVFRNFFWATVYVVQCGCSNFEVIVRPGQGITVFCVFLFNSVWGGP